MFCPFTNLCCDDGELKFKIITIGSNLYLEGPISDLLNKGLEKKFSYELKNAYWIKKRYPTANTTVRFWNPYKRLLPIGFRQGLIKTLTDYAEYKKQKLNITFEDTRIINNEVVLMPDKFVNGVVLRDYQIDAVRTFMRNGIGILELATGSGKTEIAIEIIRQLKCKTLFMCDKIELLRQTKKRIEEALGIEVGQIGAGVTDIKPITVATIQTLVKHIAEHKEYLAGINLAVYDECHKTPAKSYIKVSRYLIGTTYRLGLSATPFRDDGHTLAINGVTGYPIVDLSSKVLIDNGWLVQPMVIFIKDYMSKEVIKEKESECKIGLINETPKYPKYYEVFIANNKYRNNKIVDIVNQHKGKKILILTKLIEHGSLLSSLIEGSKHLYGATNKEERKEMLQDFISGKFNILVGTMSIFGEGLDIPPLGVIINAAGNRGDVKTIQVLGRILRKFEGKNSAIYFDFIDQPKFLYSASLARKRILIKEGHTVEVISSEQISNGI
jgi:superfamily II DNA or RNA helicase